MLSTLGMFLLLLLTALTVIWLRRVESDAGHTFQWMESIELLSALPIEQFGRNASTDHGKATRSTRDCPFAPSSLRNKIYVYPDYGSVHWKGSILSTTGRENRSLPWPWLTMDRQARREGTGHYDVEGPFAQYTTELLVRDLFRYPCLRTLNPEHASLFLVPYLSSTEFHNGSAWVHQVDPSPSPFGMAIRRLLEGEDYQAWEDTWGLTSKYWKRRGGRDHIIVFSEPLQGLWHEGNKRGNYQYINTQKQMTSPIVVSIELSKTFVEMYPHCANKNILLPYPNPDGRWYNGYYDRQVQERLLQLNISVASSPAALPAETWVTSSHRVASDFYFALTHGSCLNLRKALMWNYRQCSPSPTLFAKSFASFDYRQNMRLATFCPCPGGDSPSAKRMFDAVLAGC